jgi:diaminohydroxyphosphoribosylaminopyrimidine deaminase/5-amino-6-(5-phosphoribosylamino)uracil reductase
VRSSAELSDFFARRALALARRGRFGVAPNPKVGAVLVSPRGEIVGEGWHERAGEPHAEMRALAAAGAAARGATLYVTLEPCAHFGRTPPCSDALIAAGVAHVVASHRDPDPRTNGLGLSRLEAAGITTEIGPGAKEAIELNLPYLVSRTAGRPAVTLKWAASLDGKIATSAGESQWITGTPARHGALELREEHDAVLVGSGTVLTDDPLLTRRLGRATEPGRRVVLDRRLRTPPSARLFGEAGEVLLYTESDDAVRLEALAARGANVVRLERVDPAAVLADLHLRDVQSVLVEGGADVAGAFHDAGLWDRAVVFLAPALLGGSRSPGPLGGHGAQQLAAAGRLDAVRIRRVGRDIEIVGLNEECSRDLWSNVVG